MGRTKGDTYSDDLYFLSISCKINDELVQGYLRVDPTALLKKYVKLRHIKSATANGDLLEHSFEKTVKWLKDNTTQFIYLHGSKPTSFTKGQLLRLKPTILYILDSLGAKPMYDWKQRGDSRLSQKQVY